MNKKDYFVYGGKKLKILNQKNSYVPKSARNIVLPKSDKSALAVSVEKDLPTLLIGETGTGKTSAIRRIAYKRKQGYTRINMHGYNTPDELIGSKSVKDGATYYENGILTNAMINGHIVVLDEINATPPDCMFILHGLLDDDKMITLPNGDVIRPHKDFRFFATMNPDYEGTKTMNRAFMDRFSLILMIDILVPEREKVLVRKRGNVAKELADKMVSVAWMGRKAYSEQRTMTLISTRSLLQWAGLINSKMDPNDAYIKAIVNKARADEATAFKDYYNAVFQTSSEEDNDDEVHVTTKGEINRLQAKVRNWESKYKTVSDRNIEHVSNLRGVKTKLRKLEKLSDRLVNLAEIEKERDGALRKLKKIKLSLGT